LIADRIKNIDCGPNLKRKIINMLPGPTGKIIQKLIAGPNLLIIMTGGTWFKKINSGPNFINPIKINIYHRSHYQIIEFFCTTSFYVNHGICFVIFHNRCNNRIPCVRYIYIYVHLICIIRSRLLLLFMRNICINLLWFMSEHLY